MADELCPICGINELVTEVERMDQMCRDCLVDDLLSSEDTFESDFDEQLYRALDVKEEY